MNRLWVRLSLMIGGVLFAVFFLQFVSIMLDGPRDLDGPPAGLPNGAGRDDRAEIASRLVNFGLLALVVGGVAGVAISRVVSKPITELSHAAQRIGKGELNVRVKSRGSTEIIALANTFNQMAADLQLAEQTRRNLMADVSHELRTPLTVLEGNLRAALDQVYALDDAEIANLYGQTRHLIRLVNDLRELSLAEARQLPMEKQPADMNALLVETVQAVEPLANELHVKMVMNAPALPEVSIDTLRIRQVLMNLLSNALRHTPAGGTVTVQAGIDAGELRIAVQDTGDGLAPDQVVMVFDRFYRADPSRSRETGGTGLGLAIVKAIVEAHGGHVEASSAGKGKGATFLFALPLNDGDGDNQK
jgi:two-component system OmpR family sensor kinase/two-component system sensor histidine kinase BaeS